MKATVTAAWSIGTALWILFCALIGQLAGPGTGEAAWWLAVLFMAVVPPFAVYAFGRGVGQMFRRG